jgi:RNase adapter protein RapZ
MKLVIISGRSGSGKSTALNVLEDAGFYCIDNLPAGLLPSLIEQSKNKQTENNNLAVCIDARNHTYDIASLTSVRKNLPADVETKIVYLDASNPELIKRFSETRRKHPLSNKETTLREAIQKEEQLLAPIAAIADLHINTDSLTIHDLREIVKKRLCSELETGGMAILFTSFGFKKGIPMDADIVYDVRCLPNPYWKPELRHFSGKDAIVQDFLSQHEDVKNMFADIRAYLERWLPKFSASNRSYITISIGCTGGMHRSVYLCEQLAKHFSASIDNVQIYHRDLKDH